MTTIANGAEPTVRIGSTTILVGAAAAPWSWSRG